MLLAVRNFKCMLHRAFVPHRLSQNNVIDILYNVYLPWNLTSCAVGSTYVLLCIVPRRIIQRAASYIVLRRIICLAASYNVPSRYASSFFEHIILPFSWSVQGTPRSKQLWFYVPTRGFHMNVC